MQKHVSRPGPMGAVKLSKETIVTVNTHGNVISIEPIVRKDGSIVSAVAIPVAKIADAKAGK